MGGGGLPDGGDWVHRVQGEDGGPFDGVDCAGAGAAGRVRAEPEACVGNFGRGVEKSAGGGAGDDGAGAGGGFRLGEEEERDWWIGGQGVKIKIKSKNKN